ncbi:MAG: ABC transporter permease [Acidimicrobiia bacterium]|nr:ABC transporter permease [Acidimicrobiia bacterium]MYH06171.1 ABC transporter permease [Acidimicrobiia bacterium]MYK55529.1 ABC transporter permease [Acidimicrobiia bacterium]
MISALKRQDNWTLIGLFITLLMLIALFSWQSEFFFTTRNFINIGQAISIRGLIAIGLTVVMIAGGLDLSMAAVAAVAGMVTASLITLEVNSVLVGVLGIAAAVVLGSFNALLIVKFRINPIIATLGTLLFYRGLAFVSTGGDNIVIGVNAWSELGRGSWLGAPITVWLFLAVVVMGMCFMRFTVAGNHLYAIGGNSEACRNVGIRVDRLRGWTYVAQACLAGLAGLMLTSQSGTALPSALNGAELDIIAAVLLGGIALSGGRGGLLGTLLGLLIIGVVQNGLILLQVQIYWQSVVRGAILIIAVTLDSLRRGGGYR